MLDNFRCIRTHDHKLIQNYNAEFELNDLREDPREMRNLAGEQPDLRNQLFDRLCARFFGSGKLSDGIRI